MKRRTRRVVQKSSMEEACNLHRAVSLSFPAFLPTSASCSATSRSSGPRGERKRPSPVTNRISLFFCNNYPSFADPLLYGCETVSYLYSCKDLFFRDTCENYKRNNFSSRYFYISFLSALCGWMVYLETRDKILLKFCNFLVIFFFLMESIK